MAMNMSAERAAGILQRLLVNARESDWTTHAEDEAIALAIRVLRDKEVEDATQARLP